VFSSSEQCGFEREYAIAIAAGPLRKQDQRIADRQSFAYRVALRDGAAYSPIHENTALQLGEPTEKWPIRDFGLGDKRAGYYRTEDSNIGI
jgi:hypothetical protein